MKILKAIHGYPMIYNAGSEIYSQSLALELSQNHEVHVFTREENPFAYDYSVRTCKDPVNSKITLHIINMARDRDRYIHEGVDTAFGRLIDEIRPDIVHIGHLNHLSSSIIQECSNKNIPVVFTLHDYWLMCPRGQFMQMHPAKSEELWSACDGQEDSLCAEKCYARYLSGAKSEMEDDLKHWTDWVRRRMMHMQKMAGLVDSFIAPSRYLRERFIRDFGLPEKKTEFLDYGFDHSRLSGRRREEDNSFVFGYIGTHIPAKGIQHLIKAFSKLKGKAILRIWGRERCQNTHALKALANSLSDNDCTRRIEWLPEYSNLEIIEQVFNKVDAIVVPSIWVENSPLVIHEAQQARVPVITANIGGLAEYVNHEVNGLLFEHRNFEDLSLQMQRFVDAPAFAQKLGNHGYLYSANGDVPTIQDHSKEIENIYLRAVTKHSEPKIPSPWRITFDTNPDDCNLHCIMCEEHSEFTKNDKKHRKRRLMDISLVEKTLHELRSNPPKELIPSTMGEPLLYPHFNRILDLCRKYGIRLNLTTNGSFPIRGAESWAKAIIPVSSDIKVSINGASPQTQEAIMRGSEFSSTIRNIETLVRVRDEEIAKGENRCSITLQVTFMEKNIDELSDIVTLAIEMGIDRVKGHHLWVHCEEMKEQSLLRSDESISRWNKAVLDCQTVIKQHPNVNGGSLKLENFDAVSLNPNTKNRDKTDTECPFLGKEAWINTEGDFAPCCAPDKLRKSLGSFGNVTKEGFFKIWEKDEYRELCKTYMDRPLCQTCVMRRPLEEKK